MESCKEVKKHTLKEMRNFSLRFEFYSSLIIEKLKNLDHILSLLHERGILSEKDITYINPSVEESLTFSRSYNSLRRGTHKRPVSIVSLDKEIRHKLENELENRSRRKSTLLLYTLQEKIGVHENSENIFDDIVGNLHDTQNGFIAELLHVDPNYVPMGKREWEKIILELWDDLVSFVDYDHIAPYLIDQHILSKKQHKYYVDNIASREDRVANLLVLLSDRFQGLMWLTKALQNEGSVRYTQLAQLCVLVEDEESLLLNCHRDFIINHINKLSPIVNELYNSGGINSIDLRRICNPFLSSHQKKLELLRTLNRKRPGIVDLFKECCHRSRNIDIALILDLNPNVICHWEEVEKLKLDWDYLIKHVSYDHIYRYLLHRRCIDEKEHQNILTLPQNSDKIRQVLATLPSRNGAYEAFFQILVLKEEYREVIQQCLTMDFEESKRLLEVQDFLWIHIKNMESVVEYLITLLVIDNQEADFIISHPSQFEQNFILINTIKRKCPGTVDKLVNIFSMTNNRNCSEILAVEFKNFQMTTEEWTKLKVNWCKFVEIIRYKNICGVLLNASVISLIEHQWILKSEKNRQRIRKLLRIIPSKRDGYKLLLSAVSTVRDSEYQKLLFQSALMCPDDLQRFYTNYDFLMENTRNLDVLLRDLEDQDIISPLERKIITCYNDNCQLEELYILFLGKARDIFQNVEHSLIKSGNEDAAAVFNMDLRHMSATLVEWKALTNSWISVVNTVDYYVIRESCTTTYKLLSMKEDREIIRCKNGPEMMRKLLLIVPFRYDGFRNFTSVLMKHSAYEHIAWNLIENLKNDANLSTRM